MSVRLRARLLLPLVAAITWMSLALSFDTARSAEPSASPPSDETATAVDKPGLETVTVEARRELQHQIDHFVANAVVRYLHNSLERWDSPVCPLVAGLPKEQGEFILARVSQIATAAHAPLAGEHCKPNLYVIVTPKADEFIRKWWDRDLGLFNTCNGMGYVKHFLQSRDPIRVFYNAEYRTDGHIAMTPEAVLVDLSGIGINRCVSSGRGGSRLAYDAVQALTSVIIVVDSTRTTKINMGQLADYIGMIGLAQINLKADTGTAPTILHLFREGGDPPRSLSTWDESFLYSLYNTEQQSVTQLMSIKTGMFEKLAH